MNNYGIMTQRSGIDTDISSVKEMIFSRAREKSQALAKEKQEETSASVKNDVMNDARQSISPKTPFMFGGLTSHNVKETETDSTNTKDNTEPPKLKHNVQSADNSVYTQSVRDDAMNALRNQYSKKSDLMSSLNFLNTQAAIKTFSKTPSKIEHA